MGKRNHNTSRSCVSAVVWGREKITFHLQGGMGEITQHSVIPALAARDTGAGLLCVTFLLALPRAAHAAGGPGGFLEGLRPRTTQELPQEGKLLLLPSLLPLPAPRLRQEGALRACGRGCETVGSAASPAAGLRALTWLRRLRSPSAGAPWSVRWPRRKEIGELPWEGRGSTPAGLERLSPGATAESCPSP